jgi:hypothetical protein
MPTYHNKLLYGFVASDSRIVVYLKQSEETTEYVVKVMHKGGIKELIKSSYSLSEVLREFAETIAQHTNGFTVWKKLSEL